MTEPTFWTATFVVKYPADDRESAQKMRKAIVKCMADLLHPGTCTLTEEPA